MKHLTNPILKKIASAILCGSLLLSLSIGLCSCQSNTSEIDEIKSMISSLDNATAIAELKEMISSLDDAAAIAEVKAMIDSLDDSAAIAEIKAMLDELTADEVPTVGLEANYAEEAYEKLVYIDKAIKNRDCFTGDGFKLAQNWIIFTLMEAGYTEGGNYIAHDQHYPAKPYFVKNNPFKDKHEQIYGATVDHCNNEAEEKTKIYFSQNNAK